MRKYKTVQGITWKTVNGEMKMNLEHIEIRITQDKRGTTLSLNNADTMFSIPLEECKDILKLRG